MTTFSDQIESTMKGFMDDFSVSGKNFNEYLQNSDKDLKVAKKHTLTLIGISDEDIPASDTYTLKSESSTTWTSFPSRISETVCTKNDATATYGVRLRSSLYGWKDNFITFPKPLDSGP